VDMTETEKKLLKGGHPDAPTHNEPLTVTLDEAHRISGYSRSELYRRANRGDIIFLKLNNRVLVDYASLKRDIAGLPRAVLNIAD
jgi:hypothetical protein